VRLLLLLAAASLTLSATALAQPSSEPRALSGEFSVSYALALTDFANAPNVGPLFRANLSYETSARSVTFTADPFGLRSQGVTLDVAEGTDALSFSYTRTPGAGVSPGVGATTDVQALAASKPVDAPAFQVLFSGQSVEGINGSGTWVGKVGFSDRYREPFAGFSSIDWRASSQVSVVRIAATGSERATLTSGFGVRAAFGGERQRSFRPRFDADWSTVVATPDPVAPAAGPASGHSLRLRAGISVDATAHETLDLGTDWRFDAARPSNSQSFGVTTTRLAPLRLGANLTRSAGAGTTALAWNLDADAPLGRVLTLGAGYRGELDPDGIGHGAKARFGVRHSASTLALRANLEVGALWRPIHGFRPDGSLTVSLAVPEGGPFALSLAGSLRYADKLAAALTLDGSAEAGPVTLSFDAEAAYADALSFSGGATAAVDIIDLGDRQLGIQVGFEGRAAVGGSSALSVDLGVRYAFGGNR